MIKLLLSIYKDFGFEDVAVKFADRPPKRVGSDEIWDKSEKALKAAAARRGHRMRLQPGRGRVLRAEARIPL
jgi:threonyl-tRNA synthetase